MRGETDPQPSMFSYVDLESRISKRHPIRMIRRIVDEALPKLEPAFEQMYSDQGRRRYRRSSSFVRFSCRFSIRFVRNDSLMERIDYDLLFRWFLEFPWPEAK